MVPQLENNRSRIDELCRRYEVKRLELFGSAAGDDFDASKSDFDFLVEFINPSWQGASGRYFGLLHGLERLLEQRVDLVIRDNYTDPRFLQIADRHRVPLYVARIAKAS